MNKILGNFIQGLGKFVDLVLGGLIQIIGFLVNIVDQIRAIFVSCASFFMIVIFFSPIFTVLLINPGFWALIIFLIIFPLLGSRFLSFLKYHHYALTEFLYGKAVYYKTGKESRAYKDYTQEYEDILEENARRERERQRQAEQEKWNEFFHEFFGSGNWQHYGGGYTGGYQQGQRGGYQGQTGGLDQFKERYESATRTLGLSTDTDEYEVKLAYRKLAKQYHPDINHDEGATEMFRKVNDAYEFLSKENIEHYKRLTRK